VKGREVAEEEEEAEAAGEGQPLKPRYPSTGPYLARAHCSLLTPAAAPPVLLLLLLLLLASIKRIQLQATASWKSSCRPPPVRCTLAQ
jgi:hypothetical protein